MFITRSNTQRFILGALTACFVFGLFSVVVLAPPLAASAQAPDVVSQMQLDAAQKKIELGRTQILRASLYQAVLSAFMFFIQTLAYETAVWVASGGEGQDSLVHQLGWGEFFRRSALDSVGHFVGSLNDGLNIPGVNLCSPDLSIVLKIQLGLFGQVQKPTPRCTWNQLGDAYWREGGLFTQEGGKRVLDNIGVSFEPGQAPLAAALEVNRLAYTKQLFAVEAAKEERREGQGFKSVTELITGRIKTPSQAVNQQFKSQLDSGKKGTELSVEGAFMNSDVGWSLINTVLSTFTNTLLSKWTERLMGGFFSIGDLLDEEALLNPDLARPPGGGRDAATRLFSEFKAVTVSSIEDYDLLGEFQACPPNPTPTNCVIDTEFANAVRRARTGRPLTVREAIDEDLLDGNAPFYPPDHRDQDTSCHETGFCYKNLVKLRRARIIPIGWEIAATRSSPGTPATLNEVIAGFDRCTEAGTGDPTDPVTKWCHLIDPNWILKYPLTQCRQFATGPTLVDLAGDARAEVCVDTPSCNEEDGEGNCTGGWGYCTRERNVWRFDGDTCPAHFASCLALKGPNDRELALLTNTVDFGVCNADNAGCRWVSTLPDEGDPLGWDGSERRYFNGRAPVCEADAAGCTQLVPKARGVTLNVLRNSSFEEDTRTPTNHPDFWEGTPAVYDATGTQSQHGVRAVRLGGGNRLAQRLTVVPNRFYTLSVWSKIASGSPSVEANVMLRTAENSSAGLELSRYFMSGACTRARSTGAAEDDIIRITSAAGAEYERQACTFTTPAAAAWIEFSVRAPRGSVWVDSVQLEENESATDYGEGYSGIGAADRLHLKVPPAGLCNGNDDDPELCRNYAPVCAPTEVGCELFTPILGGPAIPGIARAGDQCPHECVGYETFREEPTEFNPAGEYPLYFIPSSADTCSVANAGCDEFTNLDTEGREYFTFLRLCEAPTPGDDTATFYTWEGSEDEGFQLRVWSLKRSGRGAAVSVVDPTGGFAPCTRYNAQDGTCVDPLPFDPSDTCEAPADIFTNPDCREFYDTDGNIHYRLFSDTIIKSGECTDYRKTVAHGEAACNESGGRFEDATGQCFYHAFVPDSRSCSAEQNQCRLYTGNAGRNVRDHFRDDFEDGNTIGWSGAVISGESLAATGSSAAANFETAPMRYAFTEEESTEMSGGFFMLSFWARGLPGTTIGVGLSEDAAELSRVTLGTVWQRYEVGPFVVSAEPTLPVRLTFTELSGLDVPDGEAFIDNVLLEAVPAGAELALIRNSWETPATCDATLEGAYSPQEMLGCATHRDRANRQLDLRSFTSLCREQAAGCQAFFNTQNSISEYAETWNYICMRPGGGSGACSVDPDGSGPATARVVCTIPPGRNRCQFRWENELVADPADVFAPPINLRYVASTRVPGDTLVLPFFYEEDLAVVPADHTVYLAARDADQCRIDVVGCRALGLPAFNQDRTTVTEYTQVYRRDLPDDYDEFLCTGEALFCAAWQTEDAGTLYFKDPLDQTCEYRESGFGGTRGWFRAGSDEPCYENFLSGGTDYGIWTNRTVCRRTDGGSGVCPQGAVGDAVQCVIGTGETSCTPYEGWAGLCPQEVSACTEFLDPSDTAPNDETGIPRYPAGRPHHFINNERLDEAFRGPLDRCDGQVSLNEGCVLFNDTSDSLLRWNAAATYEKSRLRADDPFGLVSPVNCVSPSPTDSVYCQRCATPNGQVVTNYCSSDDDCDPIARPDGFSLLTSCTADFTTNDSNRVLKVRRDRECAEWLACDQPEEVFDPRTRERRMVCSSLNVCDEPMGGGALGECRYVIDKPEPAVLTADAYALRGVSWYDKEYSGYSIPGLYPVDSLRAVNIGVCVPEGTVAGGITIPGPTIVGDQYVCDTNNRNDTDDCAAGNQCVSHFRLARVLGPCAETTAQGASCTVGSCADGRACAADGDCGSDNGTCVTTGARQIGTGNCYASQCSRAIDGVLLVRGSSDCPTGARCAVIRNEVTPPNALASMCRIYPETNAPFPNDVVLAWGEGDSLLEQRPLSLRHGFQNAQLCSRGENCDCTYQKVTYESGTVQHYTADEQGLRGVCTTGRVGHECGNDNECDVLVEAREGPPQVVTEGQCSPRSRSDQFLGLAGFCLESDRATLINGRDNAYACLTWYPVDRIAGAQDIFNQVEGVEFAAAVGNDWYCSQGDWSESGPALRTPELRIRYADGNSWQFFGSPAHVHCDPRADNWNTNYSCISTDGADDLHEHRLHDSGNCEGLSGGSGPAEWCLWPQRFCSDAWLDAGVQSGGAFLGQEQCQTLVSGRDHYGPGNQQNTFLGCYEISDGDPGNPGDDWEGMFDSGMGTMRFPWVGPDIYAWQVMRFEARLLDADGTEVRGADGVSRVVGGRCAQWTGENSDIFFTGGRDELRFYFMSGFDAAAAQRNPLLDVSSSDENRTRFALYPVWDPDDQRLRAITVLGDDDEDEAQWFIDEFAIRFWPYCQEVARVAAGESAAPYTDRVLGDAYTYPSPPAPPYTRETEHRPWGAINIPDEEPRTRVVDRWRVSNQEGDEWEIEPLPLPPGGAQDHETDALYRDVQGPTNAPAPFGASLHRLFARASRVLRFEVAFLSEDELPTEALWRRQWGYGDNRGGWDDTEDADSGATNAPKIRAVGLCNITGDCEQSERVGLTVNNQDTGDIRGVRQLRTTVRFFGWAEANRMPIRQIAIDWGDQSQVLVQPYEIGIKNRKGECSGTDFGDTSTTCDTRPFTFVKDYQCSRSILDQLDYCSTLGGNRHVGAYQHGGVGGGCRIGNACVYVPRVMLKDNWGWCTGECPGGRGGNGCYDAQQNITNPGDNECSLLQPSEGTEDMDPWVYFNGQILVEVEE